MSEFEPDSEERPPSTLERLVEAARAEKPTPEAVNRAVTAAVSAAVALTTTAAAGSASVGASAAGAGKLAGLGPIGAGMLKWAVAGFALGGAVVAGSAAFVDGANPSSTPAARAPSPARAAPPRGTAVATSPRAVDEASPPQGGSPGRGEQDALGRVGSAPPPLPGATVTSNDSAGPRGRAASRTPDKALLAAEVELLDEAARALSAARPELALARLDQYAARFDRPLLAPEALYLRMEALLAVGRTAEARSVAGAISSRFPHSAQAARARRLVSSQGENP